MEKRFYNPDLGYEVIIGKFAGQADSSIWFQQGGTVIITTVVSAKTETFPGFFPLTIDYREQFAAAGKIPGGYYKREGKFSDKEILVGRIIDRSVRPLFPEHYFNQVQVVSTVYSVDKVHAPYNLALISASVALTLSKIPFLGPVGCVEAAKINGEWILNPTFPQTQESSAKITVSGTQEGICMVEGCANEISEEEFLDIMFKAHEEIKKQVAWQNSLLKEVETQKDNEIGIVGWNNWFERAQDFFNHNPVTSVFVADKVLRGVETSKLKDSFFEKYAQEFEESGISRSLIEYIYDVVFKECLTEETFKISKRVDGRAFSEVRDIKTEVGLLPFNHGSAFFQRGRTQALVSVTLGGSQDEQRTESVMGGDDDGSFMLHYNFPPFSVGEVRALRAPGRREVGHGYLAASALRHVLPKGSDFPYTIRIVTDILESDGSSSMATVCGSTMSLMNAGVPISSMVSGIAMGLLRSKSGQFEILSDITGIEDAFGLMDFKVAGTEQGITAIQMDIKHKGGLTREVFERALARAKDGRIHIMNEMKKIMTAPNPKLSDLVPQIVSFKVPNDKVGAIIGSGGKTIREIIENTGTTIDIKEGVVKIFGTPGEKLDLAVSWVKTLAGLIESGMIFQNGKVKKVAEFGIFVELVPGVDGLVHISNVPKQNQKSLSSIYHVGSMLQVQVLEYEESTGRIRLKIVE